MTHISLEQFTDVFRGQTVQINAGDNTVPVYIKKVQVEMDIHGLIKVSIVSEIPDGDVEKNMACHATVDLETNKNYNPTLSPAEVDMLMSGISQTLTEAVFEEYRDDILIHRFQDIASRTIIERKDED